jgi:hypothetical protein
VEVYSLRQDNSNLKRQDANDLFVFRILFISWVVVVVVVVVVVLFLGRFKKKCVLKIATYLVSHLHNPGFCHHISNPNHQEMNALSKANVNLLPC